MIKYALKCRQDHEFESWFQNAAAFDDQAVRGLVVCPVCASTDVTKAIMAPALAFQVESRPEPAPGRDMREDASTPMALLDSSQHEQRTLLRALRQKILAETDDVGDRFPDEARRIHDGDIPERAIHGRATLEQAKALVQEGIGVLPLPILPEDFN
jgi:hypothetical protein